MHRWMAALAALVLALLVGCSGGQPSTAAPKSGAAPSAQQLKMAVIFPGTIADADYNTLGYVALKAAETEFGLKTAYSENVAVPDVERVLREYVDGGYDIIWTHGSQFISQTTTVAKANAKVSFIGEADAPDPNSPDNLWLLDRNFHIGFYPIAVVASKLSKSGKIGYLGGITLPFSYAEVHAAQQALKDTGSKVQLTPVWVGDLNDPTKARQVADALIGQNADVIMGSVNLGIFGLFEAVKANNGKTLVTVKYTDKSSNAPNNYVTSVLYDFSPPIREMVSKIRSGERKGYYGMDMGKGIEVQLPLKNAPPELSQEIQKLVDDIKSGKVKVNKDTTPVQ